jgi:hypothetical protein
MATKEASAGPSFGDSYATAAAVRSRYSFRGEQSSGAAATASRARNRQPAVLLPWHCASAVGGTSAGPPARRQSCGQRRAATIGVIQMSPKRCCAPRPFNKRKRSPICAVSGIQDCRRGRQDPRAASDAGLHLACGLVTTMLDPKAVTLGGLPLSMRRAAASHGPRGHSNSKHVGTEVSGPSPWRSR